MIAFWMKIHCWIQICSFYSCGIIMCRAIIVIYRYIWEQNVFWIFHGISWSRLIDWIILAQTHMQIHTTTKSHSFVHNIRFRDIIVFHLSKGFVTTFVVFETAILNFENVLDMTFLAFLVIIIWIPNTGSYDIFIKSQL